MKNGIPAIYWTFRMAWTFAHFLIVAAAAAALLAWALTDNHAARTFEPAKDNVLDLQQRVSNMIPWPWATDGGGDSAGSSSSSGGSSNSQSSGRFQVIGNVNIRVAPRPDSKRVDTVADGTWITVDCVTQGASVDPGPYQTSLSEYSGEDGGATSLWDHVPGRGYISDAYVSTVGGSGLPQC